MNRSVGQEMEMSCLRLRIQGLAATTQSLVVDGKVRYGMLWHEVAGVCFWAGDAWDRATMIRDRSFVVDASWSVLCDG